jgi:hypothetical protein
MEKSSGIREEVKLRAPGTAARVESKGGRKFATFEMPCIVLPGQAEGSATCCCAPAGASSRANRCGSMRFPVPTTRSSARKQYECCALYSSSSPRPPSPPRAPWTCGRSSPRWRRWSPTNKILCPGKQPANSASPPLFAHGWVSVNRVTVSTSYSSPVFVRRSHSARALPVMRS